MKRTFLIFLFAGLMISAFAQGIYNSGARIVSTTGSYWVVDNGDFALSNASATNLAQFANLTITSDASLTLGTTGNPAYVTVSGTLANSSSYEGLIIPSGSSLIESSGADATVKRSIAPGEWHLISAPTSNATSGIFYGHYLQIHTEATNVYTDVTRPDEELSPMKGFALYGDLDPAEVTFVGPLNAGNNSFSTTRAGSGWNLAGNPYPSGIDWDAASGWTKTNINAATYVHINPEKWASYVGTTGNNGGSRYIAPMQGFFVQASDAGTLAMTDEVRVHHATSFFKRTEVVSNLLRLQVSGNGYKDEAVMRFLPEATPEFDGEFDAHKFFGDVAEAPQIYTLGNTPLSINSLPEAKVVQVGLSAGASGTFTISGTEINNLQDVTLEDTQTGAFTPLAQNSYTFGYTKGENANRFLLHFNMLSVPVAPVSKMDIYSYRKTVYFNLGDKLKSDIFISNLAGQQIASRTSASGMIEMKLNNTGVYVVKVINKECTVVRKVFIE